MSLSTQFVMVPLYVWPEADQTTGGHTWDPLFEAAGKHPDVQFQIVINPSSGPGDSCPPPDYKTVLDRINSDEFDNIKTLGYVATGYADKEVSEVNKEVEMYVSWSAACGDKGVTKSVDGIFFDEAAYKDDPEDIQTVKDVVEHATEVIPNSIIHLNPGTALESDAYWAIADSSVYITVFENEQVSATENGQLPEDAILGQDGSSHADQAVLMYKWYEGTGNQLTQLVETSVNELEVAGLFISNFEAGSQNSEYNEFGSDFGEFADAFANALESS